MVFLFKCIKSHRICLQLTCFWFRFLTLGEVSSVISGPWIFMCGMMGMLSKGWMKPSLQTSLDGSPATNYLPFSPGSSQRNFLSLFTVLDLFLLHGMKLFYKLNNSLFLLSSCFCHSTPLFVLSLFLLLASSCIY